MIPTDLPTVRLACRPFGHPAVLVLVVPTAARSLLAAVWCWPWGAVSEATIGRA